MNVNKKEFEKQKSLERKENGTEKDRQTYRFTWFIFSTLAPCLTLLHVSSFLATQMRKYIQT